MINVSERLIPCDSCGEDARVTIRVSRAYDESYEYGDGRDGGMVRFATLRGKAVKLCRSCATDLVQQVTTLPDGPVPKPARY